jgi:hypothetical protein
LLGKMLYGPEDNIPIFSTPVLPEFFFLVRRAISRKPEDRYQSAKELLKDIDACLALLPPSLDSRVPTQPSTAAFTGTVHLQRETRVPSEESPRALIRKAIVRPRRPLALVGVALLLGVVGIPLFLPSVQTDPASNPAQEGTPRVAVPPPAASPLVHSDVGEEIAAQTQATAVSESTPNVTMPEEETEEKSAEGAPVSPQATAVLESTPPANDQLFSSPRRFRVTTLTAVRENPTWRSKEITWLKPGARVYAVARVGEWLKIESRARPPKPPGFVWKADTRRE